MTAPWRASLFLLWCALQAPSAAMAQEVDRAVLDAGTRVYKEAAGCWGCHGWAGTGGLPVVGGSDRNPGPPLVASRLDRAAMIEVVSCGRPGTDHPPFARGAWTAERRCYGKVRADLGPQEQVPDPQITLTQGQIEAVVTYVQAVYQSKSMTRENCLRYFGVARTPVCDPFP